MGAFPVWAGVGAIVVGGVLVVLAPAPDWVRSLPDGKLPDRNDFLRYGNDLQGRIRAWRTAAEASRRLADEFAQWLDDGCSMRDVLAL